MKYEKKITILLLSMFLLSQFVGLVLLNSSISSVERKDGKVIIEHKETPVGRIELSGVQSLIFVLISIGIGTGLVLVLVKLRLLFVWKFWFFLAAFITTAVSLSVFLDQMVAIVITLVLVLWTAYRTNPFVHNLTEIFVFSGIAILFVPIFSIFWMTVFLVIISIYDIIAVRKTKHMVNIAMFLDKSKAFAGFSIPLGRRKKTRSNPGNQETNRTRIAEAEKPDAARIDSAVLGGGDIAFSLLFSGVVLEELLLSGIGRTLALLFSFVVTVFIAAALVFLLMISKKGRFYPAMPFISTGAVAGYLFVLFLTGFLAL